MSFVSTSAFHSGCPSIQNSLGGKRMFCYVVQQKNAWCVFFSFVWRRQRTIACFYILKNFQSPDILVIINQLNPYTHIIVFDINLKMWNLVFVNFGEIRFGNLLHFAGNNCLNYWSLGNKRNSNEELWVRFIWKELPLHFLLSFVFPYQCHFVNAHI